MISILSIKTSTCISAINHSSREGVFFFFFQLKTLVVGTSNVYRNQCSCGEIRKICGYSLLSGAVTASHEGLIFQWRIV